MIIAYIEECSQGSIDILLSLQNYTKNAGEIFFEKIVTIIDMWCVRKVPGLELQIICNKKLYRLQLSPFTVVPLMSNTLPYSAPPCFHPLLEWFF